MKFSIITPTHNRGHLIAETIQSVLAQTHSDFEHIIIDDGSTDNTETVVKGFQDPRIKYYKYPKQEKRSILRNEGIRKATGEYISILDSDDIWHQDKLAKVASVFTSFPEIGFVFHGISFIPQGISLDPKFPYSADQKNNFFLDILRGNFHPYPVFTIRKAALDEIGLLDESMLDGQIDLYLRVSSIYDGYFINEKLIDMRKHDGNVSRHYDLRHMDDFLQTIEKLRSDAVIDNALYHKMQAKIHQKIGYFYYGERRYNLARKSFRASYAFDKSYIGINSLIMLIRSRLKFS